ncbi:MAG: TIR domain-containing protein [Anaerolineaceae bacterium]|nr:TIR domain-containing protein [Anaerolineaceae bacterium]
MMTDVFISYSRKDAPFVHRLHEALAKQERDVWVDWEDIPLTADWWREIQNGIEATDAFAFVISPDSVRSDVCRREIDHAIANNKRIIPILHRAVIDPAEQKLMHPSVGSHNWIFFRESDDFDAAFQKLVNALDTDLSHVREHTRLLVHAKEWNNGQRNSSYLLQGDELKKAETWLEHSVAKSPKPTALHAEYIGASRQAAVARQRRLLAGVSVALVVSIGLSILSFVLFWEANNQRSIADANAVAAQEASDEAQRQEAIARSIGLAGQAEVARNDAERRRDEGDDVAARTLQSRSVLLGLEALNVYGYTWQAERALGLAVRDQFAKVELAGHTDEVFDVAWSPDGTWVATASADKTAKIWVAETGQQVYSLRHNDVVNSAAWSPDGRRVVTASNDYTARVWDLANGASYIELVGHTGSVLQARWSPDGMKIATASADGTARIWDAQTGEMLLTLRAHQKAVNSAEWSPDGTKVVTASEDNTAIIWDAATGELLHPLEDHTRAVNRALWSHDGTRILTASDDKTARVWDATTGKSLLTLSGHTREVNRAVWSPDGTRIATASGDRTARIYDAQTGALLFTLFGHVNDVLDVAWSLDSQRLVTTSQDHTARVWDASTGAELINYNSHTNAVYSVEWSPDGTFLATASADHTSRLWEIWTDAAQLATFARGCCAVRDLTDEERQQIGLPLVPNAPPPADGIPSCPDAPVSQLYDGVRGIVVDDGTNDALRVRAGAGLTRSIIDRLSPSQTFQVIEGPQCADGFAWFHVLFGINAVDGWVAEADDSAYFAVPFEQEQ